MLLRKPNVATSTRASRLAAPRHFHCRPYHGRRDGRADLLQRQRVVVLRSNEPNSNCRLDPENLEAMHCWMDKGAVQIPRCSLQRRIVPLLLESSAVSRHLEFSLWPFPLREAEPGEENRTIFFLHRPANNLSRGTPRCERQLDEVCDVCQREIPLSGSYDL